MSKKIIIIVVIVVLAGIGYFLFSNYKIRKSSQTQTNPPSSTVTETTPSPTTAITPANDDKLDQALKDLDLISK